MKTKTMLRTMMAMQLAVATLAGAASVKYDMDGSVEIAKLEKVAFVSPPSKGEDAIADKRLRAALTAALEAKGYELVDGSGADLTVDYFAVVRQRRELVETGGPRFGRNLRLRQLPEGTLVVSFALSPSGEVVWHGLVTDAIASSPERANEMTEKAVAKLLEKFPSRQRW